MSAQGSTPVSLAVTTDYRSVLAELSNLDKRMFTQNLGILRSDLISILIQLLNRI